MSNTPMCSITGCFNDADTWITRTITLLGERLSATMPICERHLDGERPRMIITEALKLILYRHETGDLKYGLSKDDVDELEVALSKAERKRV